MGKQNGIELAGNGQQLCFLSRSMTNTITFQKSMTIMIAYQPYQESGKSQIGGHPLYRRKERDCSNEVVHYYQPPQKKFFSEIKQFLYLLLGELLRRGH